jgi:hypothetical protein
LSSTNQERHHLILNTGQLLNLQYPISNIFFSSSRDATISSYSLREILKTDRYGGGSYVSTCHGILCYNLPHQSALLLNPSIRKFIIILPPPPLKYGHISYTLVYDRFIHNYKLIALNPKVEFNVVHILVLGTDYWTSIPDFPSSSSQLMHTSTGIFVNDSVNWLSSHFIVSLDWEKESYQKLSLPVAHVQLRPPCLGGTIGTWKGCLSLLVSMQETFSHVWIMKEFGNEKSWTKLLSSIPYMKEWWPFRYIKLLYVSEDHQVLMEIYTKMNFRLLVYDSINNTFYFPEFQNKISEDALGNSEVYVESLISPF